MEKGNEQVNVAKRHAVNRNKLKRWCVVVVIFIIVAIALGVGLGIGLAKKGAQTTGAA